jgi:hypothetical protein
VGEPLAQAHDYGCDCHGKCRRHCKPRCPAKQRRDII